MKESRRKRFILFYLLIFVGRILNLKRKILFSEAAAGAVL